MGKQRIAYLRVIVTNDCPLHCTGCHQEGQTICQQLPQEELLRMVVACIDAGIRKVKLIGGEPTCYPDLLPLIRGIKTARSGIDLSMISNGLQSVAFYRDCLAQGLDRLNLSIHGWTAAYFCRNTHDTPAAWRTMRETLRALLEAHAVCKLNYVWKRGENEADLMQLIPALAAFPDVRLDLLNFLVTSPGDVHRGFFLPMEEIEAWLDAKFTIRTRVVHSNPYSLDSLDVTLGNGLHVNLKNRQLRDTQFLNACATCAQRPFCTEGITAVRLTTAGMLQPCLLRDDLSLDLLQTPQPDVMEIQQYFSAL